MWRRFWYGVDNRLFETTELWKGDQFSQDSWCLSARYTIIGNAFVHKWHSRCWKTTDQCLTYLFVDNTRKSSCPVPRFSSEYSQTTWQSPVHLLHGSLYTDCAHDIDKAVDSKCVAAVDLVDLAAVFDRGILQKHSFGLSWSALSWLQSYLGDIIQFVTVGTSTSEGKFLECGVPQGSVLGPRRYGTCSKSIGTICQRHCYADDTYLYVGIMPKKTRVHASTKLVPEWV